MSEIDQQAAFDVILDGLISRLKDRGFNQDDFKYVYYRIIKAQLESVETKSVFEVGDKLSERVEKIREQENGA